MDNSEGGGGETMLKCNNDNNNNNYTIKNHVEIASMIIIIITKTFASINSQYAAYE